MAIEDPETTNPSASAPSAETFQATPRSWRIAIAIFLIVATLLAYCFRDTIGTRGQAEVGAVCFFAVVALFSTNLRQVNWKTIGWGIVLQMVLALLVLKVNGVYRSFEWFGTGVKSFVEFSGKGATAVFGNLADARPAEFGGTWTKLFPKSDYAFQFAFVALPPILFISAFFTLLYHLGILQWFVRFFAWLMVYVMRTSGAETLSVSANVFMGMTEAPLIVKPYVPRMTNSELFALMVSGMAHISGGMMVIYVNYGADPVAILTTCIMACPCSLYLAKLLMPETSIPETSGRITTAKEKSPYVNSVDAIASGTSDGLRLALNVAAMLIVFIAFVAMFDKILQGIKPSLEWMGAAKESLAGWPKDLSLQMIFGWLFSPVAFLIGIEPADVQKVGSLLGAKLAINEHVAYLQMKEMRMLDPHYMSERSYRLAAFALTGFANFASVGIQLGGIGAMAPERRHDLARLGGRALFVGFVATLLNAAIAGILL